MPMSIVELERSLRLLHMSGMARSLTLRAQQMANGDLSFAEGVSLLIQDELDVRRTRLQERRLKLSGLKDPKDLTNFDWHYNERLPRKEVYELATMKFVDAHEDVLILGPPGTGKSHVGKALALLAIHRGFRVLYRDTRKLFEELSDARNGGTLFKVRNQLRAAELLVIDDLFLLPLPPRGGEDLADILLNRNEERSTIITSNRPLEDWGHMLGDVVIAAPLIERIMHHGHLLRFEGKSWRLKYAAERVARGLSAA